MGSSERWRIFAVGALSLATIFISSYFSLRVFSTPDSLPMIWLPTGVILSLLLITTGARQVSVLLGAFVGGMLFNYIRFRSVPMSLLISMLFCARGVVGAFLMKGFSAKRFSFEKASDLLGLIVYPIVIVGPVFSLFNAVFVSLQFGVPLFTFWFRWWLVSSLGVIVVAPWLVSWSRMPISRRLPIRATLETGALIGAVVLIFVFVHAPSNDTVAHWMYTMGIVPILMLAALRFDLRGVSFVLLVVTFLSLLLISDILGAHADHSPSDQKAILGMQFALLLTAVVTQGYSIVVAERREAESVVRLQSAAMNAAANAIAIADVAGTTTYVNEAHARLVGLAANELVGKGTHLLWSVPPPGNGSAEPWNSILSGKVWSGETRCARSDGTEFLEKLTITPLHNAEGQIGHFISVGEDITERKDAEERYRKLFFESPNAKWTFDPETFVSFEVNIAALKLFGYTREEFLSMEVTDLVQGDCAQAFKNQIRQNQSGAPTARVWGMRRKDGSTVQVELSISRLILQGQSTLLAVGHDETDKIRTQNELVKSEQLFRAVFEHGGIGMGVANPDGIAIKVNEAFLCMTGYSQTDVIGSSFRRITHPDDAYLDEVPFRELLGNTKDMCQFEKRYLHKNGSDVDSIVTLSAVRDLQGQPQYVVGMVENITERKQAEKALSVSREQLKGLSHRLLMTQESERRRLALELHDEIGQSLSAVKINLGTLRQAPEISVVRERLEDSEMLINHAINEVRALAHQLRPAILDDLGLVPAIRWHVDGVAQRTKMRGTFSCRGLQERLHPDVEIACFRIVQEGLNNIQKHAAARSFSIELNEAAATLQLFIRDDGSGFNVQAALDAGSYSRSFGLLGMKERAELVDGRLEISSQKGHGSVIKANLPLIRRKQVRA